MNPKTYENLRNELIILMQQAVALDAVDDETRALLTRIRRKTLENQFEIVLAGEFQGGKSTTFNALCDGRELSPTGSGIKTSGCLVSAQNLSDPHAPETAEAEWRTSGDLVAGFSDLLLPHLQNLVPRRFEKATASDLGKLIDLEMVADRQFIAEAARQEWKVWQKDRAGYDPEQKGLLDVLRCATLIAHYYGHPLLRQVQGKEQFAPWEIGEMAAFPSDWEERWQARSPERFEIREVRFIFIAHIRLRIRSDNLGRLGCVLTDCPGLFASRWDTEIARRAMFNADAILYLFDGSKTLKLSDLRALEFIRKNGMAHKLFYGCNMRGHTLSDSQRILRASITALKNSGFQVREGDFALFHALLALRSIQGERLLTGVLPAFTRNKLSADAPEQAICKVLRRQMALLDAEDDGADMAALTPAWVRQARHLSGLDQLTEMAEQTVISRKARAILVDNGSEMAAACLMEAEGALQAREANAFKKEREFRQQVAETEAELRKFRGQCSRIIERLDERGPDYALADQVWERLAARQEELAEKILERIYREVVRRFSLSLLVKQKFKNKVTGIIKEEIDACFTETINAWVAELRDGNNPVYTAQLVRRVQSVSKELKQLWDASALSEMNLMSGIALPEFSGDLDLDTATILRELTHSQSLENVRYNALLAAGGVTGIFTATSGIIVAVYLLITRLFWVRIVTVVVFLVNILLMILAKGMVEKGLREEIRRNLSPALEMLFHEIREDVKQEFRQFSENIRQLYKEAFEAAADRPSQIFETRTQQAETDFARSREERLAVAREARRIREEQIQPLRLDLQRFTAKVAQCLPDACADQEAPHDPHS